MTVSGCILPLFPLILPFALSCIPTETPDDMYEQESTTTLLPTTSVPTTIVTSTTTTTTTTSTTTSTTTTTTSYVCPNGWTLNPDNDFCYFPNTMSLSFDQAEAMCAMVADGHLTSITNMAEQDFVYNLIASITTGSQSVWIGLMQDSVTGVWTTPITWTDNTPYTYMTSYDNWAGGEPNGMAPPAFCARIYVRFAFDTMWDDDDCAVENLSVCKAPRLLIMGASTLHIYLSLLFTPVQILPATIFCSEGLLKDVVPGVVFFPVFNLLLCVFAGSVLPLFYHRLRVLLPDTHLFNGGIFVWSFHFIFYIFVFFIPIPFMLLTFKKQISLKQLEFSGVPHLEVHCVGYNFAHWDSFAVLGVLLFAAALFLVIIVTFTTWTYKLLEVARTHMSRITVQEHRVVFFALVNTVTVYSIFYVFPCLVEVGSIILKKGSIGKTKRLRIGDYVHFNLHLIFHFQFHNDDHFQQAIQDLDSFLSEKGAFCSHNQTADKR